MSGPAASLGLRSGSYGSLASVAGSGAGCVGRKAGARGWAWRGEKERLQLLHRALRLVGRRRAGVLLLLAVASAAVFCSLFAVVKDDSNLISIVNNYEVPNAIQKSVYPSTTRPLMMSGGQYSTSVVNKIELPNRLHLSYANFTYPCEGFSVPPPLVDKKRTGPRPCPVCYVSVDQAFALMPLQASPSPVLKNLNYVSEDSITANLSNQGSGFGGHPSLEQRNKSFDINESMTVHCGFVRGDKPGKGTGFDIKDDDLLEMEQCRELVVASAIFGNYDMIQHPRNISEFSKANACFYMFVDEETEAYVNNSSSLYSNNKIGLWRLVVARNLPYEDPRRTGKIPKLLLHRLFPNVRFSVWIDAKLQLFADPYLLLERFLWRNNTTFAISRHYKRFDVFEEAEANKAAGKYDNASIDYQIEFYRNEGLAHYSPAKLPITSDVPEGCVIIREHIPITNLFTCLWFNEVDRFTSRDQISFSTVRDKIRARVGWMPEMFLDCERRNFVVQAYHRELLEQMIASGRKPPSATDQPSRKLRPGSRKASPSKKPSVKRKKEKKSSSRRRLPKPVAGGMGVM
ncbi:probable hexosyltransferase MUCI70 isoform X1 [Phragmites australis]|uniref:probable hexosyltransferase MUCI70 isoform X1 n=2 Tax=Phragmites australis TaxID=29695 RepID=UPI002D775A91|nr:probable hexosyltransferase MUCI70 isoform X1 [Phragmites australis]